MDKPEANLLHLGNLNDITTQINRKKKQFAMYIYDNYLKGKTENTESEFLNKIFKKRRPVKLEEDKICEEDSETQCDFIVWNKGNLRQCFILFRHG